MYIKRIFAIVMIFFLVAGMTACTSITPSAESKLKIYYAGYDTNTVRLMSEYLKSHKAANGISIAFGQEKQIETALLADSKSNEEPDVLILPYNALPQLSKFLEAGIFCDLNELITKDNSIKLSDYNSKILDSGVYNGKRYIIPLNYMVNVLATTDSTLKENNISKNWSALSLKRLYNTVKDYKSKNPLGYFFDMLSFYSLMANSGRVFLDMQNKKADFNAVEFTNLADNYSAIRQSVIPPDELLKIDSDEKRSELLKDEKIATLSIAVTKISDLYKPYVAFDSKVDPVILPQPYANDKIHIVARPQCFVAINSKCTDKKAAFELVKMLLGNDYQGYEDAYGLPVNIKAFDIIEKAALKNKNNRNAGCKSDDAVKSIISQLNSIISSIDKVDNIDFKLSLDMQDIIDNTNIKGKEFKSIASLLQSIAGEYFTQKLAIPGENTGKDENSVKSETLSLYYIDQYLILGKTILKYNNKSEKVKIKPRIFEYTGNDTFDELSRVLTTEIMAGAGPDIVCFKPEREFSSVNKVIASGAFADLNELIAEDSEFNIEDFNKIINVGVYNGKRYFIPYDYNVPAFFTTEKTLKNNQIIVNDGNLTFDEIRTAAENFINIKSRKSKFLFNSELTFFNLLSLYGSQFYSNNNKNYDFNSKEFKELLNFYKKMQPVISTKEVEEKYGSSDGKLIKNNVVAMIIGTYNAFNVESSNSLIEHNTGEKLETINIIKSNKSSYMGAYIKNAVAINSHCKNKKAAFEFVKTLLSKDIQTDEVFFNCQMRNESLKNNIEMYSGNYGSSHLVTDGTNSTAEVYSGTNMPVSLSDKLLKVHSNLAEAVFMDKSINTIINDALLGFLEGKSNADQTAKLINDKVTLFNYE